MIYKKDDKRYHAYLEADYLSPNGHIIVVKKLNGKMFWRYKDEFTLHEGSEIDHIKLSENTVRLNTIAKCLYL